MRRRARIPATAALAGGVTVVLWASAFVGIRSASRHLEAGPLALGRLLVAAGVLGALTLVRRSRRERPRLERSSGRFSRRDAGAILLCGVLWFGAYNLALNQAERQVDAGTAAMLVNVGPILIALLAGVVLREGLPRNLARGLAVAFIGAVVIGLATRSRSAAEGTGALLCLLAALFYAGAVVAQKPVLARHAALEVTFLACLAGLIVCLPFAPRLVTELRHAPTGAIAWTAYLGAGPTAIAFTTWAYALTRTTAGRMGALTYLVPPLAVLFGWLLLGETPPALAILGGALCLAGVALTRARSGPGGRPGGEGPASGAGPPARRRAALGTLAQ